MSRQKKRRGTPRPKLAELNRSRVKRPLEPDFSRDLVAWIDATITKNELGQPFQLFDFQRAVLRRMFTFDARGRLPYNTIVFSTVKKSGKSFINALAVLWWALTQDSPNEILILANDLEQAMGRVFATVCGLIKQNPALRARAKIKQKEIVLDNGTTITVLPSEYAGAAGSNHGLTSWDELWAYDSESAVRLWEELTPVPTRRNSIRFVTTYAGFEGESALLRGLYLRGVGSEEAPEGQGTRLEPDLPIYANGRLCVFWDHEARLPWQDADYYESQRAELRPNAYIRFHENKWTSGESVFLTAAMWDAVTDDRLSPLEPTKEGAALYVGVDIGIKSDFTGVAAVKRVREGEVTRVHLVRHCLWKPQPGSPVDLRAVADYLRWLCTRFKVKQILVDPSQALQLVTELKAEGLPIEEYPQTVQHVTEMGSAIFTTIQARTLRVYPDAELRRQALNTIAVESTRGWKIDKAKAANKIDAIVALSMAVRAALEAPQGFEPLVWHDTKSWIGRLEQTAAAHAPELHPHERLEPEGPPEMSERKAAAWRGELPEPKPPAPILEVDGRPVTELKDGMVSFYCQGSSSVKGCGVRATCRRGELEGVWRRHLRDQHAPETPRRSSAQDRVSVIRTGYGPFGSP